MIDDKAKRDFIEAVWTYSRQHGRSYLPWRTVLADGKIHAYEIMVSEMMLQQTQVSRVIPKYSEFLNSFPTVETLAAAPLGDVLRAWSGLGYNRRAKFLYLSAQSITSDFNGIIPDDTETLVSFPGIGSNTAAAVLVYAVNRPEIFIETNIRSVFIHHFFQDNFQVEDSAVLELVRATLVRQNPREWYWALMDYGTHLKSTIENLNQRSKAYVKQSAFAGSRRQIRGRILSLLAETSCSYERLNQVIEDHRVSEVLSELVYEGLIQEKPSGYHL